MVKPIPLHRYPEPDPHWLADLTAPAAADALSYLLAAASDILDWIDDEDAETIQAIIELAGELVVIVTEDAEHRSSVSFPASLTAQAADHISDAADRFEAHKTYDACRDEYDQTAIFRVGAMRQTARDLLRAARTA